MAQDLNFKKSGLLEQEIKNAGLFLFWISTKPLFWLLDSEQTFPCTVTGSIWCEPHLDTTGRNIPDKSPALPACCPRSLMTARCPDAHSLDWGRWAAEAFGWERCRCWKSGGLVCVRRRGNFAEREFPFCDGSAFCVAKKKQQPQTTSENPSRFWNNHPDSLQDVSLLEVVFAPVL